MPAAQITYNVTKEYAEELFGLTTHEYTLEELRHAFRERAYECHPDMATDEADLIEREAKCRIVNMAYARLKKQFIGKGDITVKPMDEMIRESYEQSTNSSDESDAIDDIIDFLDDFDDDISIGNIPNWMAQAQHRIAYSNNASTIPINRDINAQFNHIDWNVSSDNNEETVKSETVYSLPPFLRSQYLNRGESHCGMQSDYRNDSRSEFATANNHYNSIDNDQITNRYRQNNRYDCNHNDINHRNGTYRPMRSRDDMEAEIDRIMAKILHDAGC